MIRRVTSPLFVGRARELGDLVEAASEALAGSPRTVLIAGEAGVGKTRLLGQLRSSPAVAGARWLEGDCIPLGEHQLPYAPITAVVRSLARDSSDALPILTSRPELAALLPELGGSGAVDRSMIPDGSLAQARLFEQLLALCIDLQPLVLVVEDLHWADRSTRDFLSFLVRNMRDERVLLMCTYRAEELDRRHPLRPFLVEHERLPTVQNLVVNRFSRPELQAQLEGILGEPSDLEVADTVFERSEGNAFFAEELLAAWQTDDARLPPTVRDALILRVEALSEPTRRVLRLAAACGRRVPDRLLAAVADVRQTALEDSLREALGSQVLTQDSRDGTFAFRHALLREAVYSDVLPGERARIHLALAETMSADRQLAAEATGNPAAELAFHWRGAHRPADALAASIEAGRQAERSFASAEANRHFEQALELWDVVEDPEARSGMRHADVLLRAAENAAHSGQVNGAVVLARKALALINAGEEPVSAALAHEALGRFQWFSGEPDAALAAYRESVNLLPAEPPTAERARALAGEGAILMLRGRPDESRSRCEEAIAIARRVGAVAEEAHALCTLGSDLCFLGDRDRGLEHLRKANQMTEQIEAVGDLGRTYQNLADGLAQAGRLAGAVDVGLMGAGRQRGLGLHRDATYLLSDVATWLLRLGRLGDADAVIARGLETRQQGVPAAMLHSARCEVELQRGELDRAEQTHVRAVELAGATGDSMHLGFLTERPALLALAHGDSERAANLVENAVSRMDPHEYVIYTARTYAVGVRAHADRAARARALADPDGESDAEQAGAALLSRLSALLEPSRWIHSPPPESVAYGALALAELERLRGDASPATWEGVAEHWDSLAYPLELGYALWRRAEVALSTGAQKPLAATSLAEAGRLANVVGARLLETDVAALARRARIDLPGDAPTKAPGAAFLDQERFGLSERELEVLALLADGRTNPQIARALFISPKTASAHVSHILAKLAVQSRVEAATTAQRLGLIPRSAAARTDASSGDAQ